MSHKIQKKKFFFKIKTNIFPRINCMWIQNYLFLQKEKYLKRKMKNMIKEEEKKKKRI